jgi:hypothetical protein
MNRPIDSVITAVALALVPFATGCAEEEAEAPAIAYPVGATTPRLQAAGAEAPLASRPVIAESQLAAAESPEIVIGADTDEQEGAAAGGQDGTSAAPPRRGPQLDGTSAALPPSYSDADPSALTDFHTTLDPYGNWVEDTTYGTVWVPSSSVVGADFTPYVSGGHWAYDDDYVWVSDYDWGWAPFHYGRWIYVAGVGWEWIPGRAYAGAWVSWRYGWGDWAYVGWAPLPPTWCWHRGVAVGIGFVPAAPYAFVSTGDLFAPRVGARVVVGERGGVIGAHTRPWAPEAAGRVLANPGVGGPPPSALRIPASAVVRADVSQGISRAHAFARPSTAVEVGATAPRGVSRAPAFVPRVTAPAYGPPVQPPSYHAGAMPMTPSYRAPTPVAPPTFHAGAASLPTFSPPSYHVGGAAPSYHAAAPAPSFHSAPSFHGYSGGGVGVGGHGGGGGGRGGGHR